MPPRPRRVAPDAARAALLAQWRLLDDALRALPQPPAALRERLTAARLAVDAAVDAAAPADALVAQCVDAVVHALDLAAAAQVPPPLDSSALRLAVRALADVLSARAPGRSVEVRIPGPAGTAVQCVEGPRHTRGTPPNVVETDAVTFVELATGRLSWASAVAAGRLTASGERADLSAYLPLVRPAG